MSKSYENAPATKFLATHCACCGRKLVDAVSVERAIGPECYKRHGADTEPGPADWTAVRCFLGNFGAVVRATDPTLVTTTDARKVANVLVHRFARNYRTARWVPDAVFALGFPVLAARLAKRAHVKLGDKAPLPLEVRVTTEQYTDTYRGRTQTREVFVVRAPYSLDFNAAKVPSRWWDRTVKAWRCPVTSKPALWEALKTSFPGLPLVTPSGATVTLPDPEAQTS